MKRLGVDVGGTFTDLIHVDDDGAVSVHKVPSTPSDPSQATLGGALELCHAADVAPEELDQFFHGTTVATNIILEHNGAEVGLLTTRGFRDILHIARHKKPLNWSNFQELPWQRHPLVKRRYRMPITERVTAPHGEVLVPLDEGEVVAAVRELKAQGVEAIAVCFLFSFLNPDHERRVKKIVLEEFPEAFLSVRHEVLPQYREYEGFSTVCLNAYVGPKVSRYVRRLASEMSTHGFDAELHLMSSTGGVLTAESAAEKPVTTMFSGPIAGLIGGIWAGRSAGAPGVISQVVADTAHFTGNFPAACSVEACAADIALGKAKAAEVCETCHGAAGNSTSQDFPKLGGQYRDYLEKALRDYKSGDRKNAIMAGFAKPLSKEEIDNLAAYYAAQPAVVSSKH